MGACRRTGCKKYDSHYRSHSEVELYEDVLAMGNEFHNMMRVLVTEYADEGYKDAKSCFLSAHSKLVLTYKERDNAGSVLAFDD